MALSSPTGAVRSLARPAFRGLTYARWLHLLMVCAWPSLLMFVFTDPLTTMAVAAVSLACVALVPAMRTAEALQARLLLARHGPRGPKPDIEVAPSRGLRDCWRLMLWLETRLVVGAVVSVLSLHLPATAQALFTGETSADFLRTPHGGWWPVLAPLPLLALYALVVGAGGLMAVLAGRLLGPSPQQRFAALEARAERLQERNRIAAELHDSIGHALTVAVLQAGAARTAGSAEFTDRALTAIEETGRAALEDLERVLRVLRDPEEGGGGRPTLKQAEVLFDSARGAGATVDVEVTGALERLPGAVSREGYRILQESLTNVLRHSGPVPVRVRIAVADSLALEVSNPLPGARAPFPGGGTGLRGVRERAALLGGAVRAGREEDEWRVRVSLPLG
ncbi:sensor histidine kinase [Streptomyces sp. NPDC007088]|uniref:sensor histidine kinase n=1 Tax=Streptomyces sp. NPDC007088 TaxID=3364773 RepID=UPI0036C062E4